MLSVVKSCAAALEGRSQSAGNRDGSGSNGIGWIAPRLTKKDVLVVGECNEGSMTVQGLAGTAGWILT